MNTRKHASYMPEYTGWHRQVLRNATNLTYAIKPREPAEENPSRFRIIFNFENDIYTSKETGGQDEKYSCDIKYF